MENPTLALDVVDRRRVAITLPRGAIVKVVAGPTGDGDRLVDINLGRSRCDYVRV